MENTKKSKGRIKKIFVVQGKEGLTKSLSQLVKEHLGIESKVPEYGQEVKL